MVFGEIGLGNESKLSFRLCSSDAALKTNFAPTLVFDLNYLISLPFDYKFFQSQSQ